MDRWNVAVRRDAIGLKFFVSYVKLVSSKSAASENRKLSLKADRRRWVAGSSKASSSFPRKRGLDVCF